MMYRTCHQWMPVVMLAVAVALCGDVATSTSHAATKGAVSAKSTAYVAGAEKLRSEGPEALARLLAQRDELIARGSSAKDGAEDNRLNRQIVQLNELIDEVAGQRYACVSRLYWYTDLEKAKQAAHKSGRPILSLRMLGNLTDEYSCANSRFFRTTLYSNQEISQRLQDRFVLHWQSVRPVPRITIDFGDGRKIERTITGNSAHYVLAADGSPLDVLPGLYSPQKFLNWLNVAEMLHQHCANLPPENRAAYVQNHHAARADAVARDWARDLVAVAPELASSEQANARSRFRNASTTSTRPGQAEPEEAPPANAAMLRAVTKSRVEMPIVLEMAGDPARLSETTSDELWNKIAALPAHAVALDQASISVIRQENPTAIEAAARAVTKSVQVEDPVLRLISNLQNSIALDTIRNEYLLHREIHQWFAAGSVDGDAERLNERVYAEIFLTPSSDPWLGLDTPDRYTALENGGVSRATN
ncbi:MAG: hypothetical protein WDZ59_12255 [Pirellulales bacterium]